MSSRFPRLVACGLLSSLSFAGACGDDDGPGTQADRFGVGAECSSNDDCFNPEGSEIVQQCLTEFKGGYCGIRNCSGDVDCPQGSACVAHDDGVNYCFRLCADKPECNNFGKRSVDNESNCSSSIEFVESAKGAKACVPPSSG